MANFGDIPLDKDVQENTGEFTVLPAGKYKACLVGDELRDNKAGNGKIWEVKLQVMEGQYAGEVLTDYINITNPSQQSQAIGQGTLRRICNLTGVPYPPTDTAGMMGKPLVIGVKVDTFKSNTTGKELKRNEIKSYSPPEKTTTSAPAEKITEPSGW